MQEGDCIQDYNAVGCHDLDPNDSSTSQQPSVFEDGPTSWRHLQRSQQRDGITYVGRLAIGPGIVGYGSSGTLVFEGSLDGRQVAVKRVLRQASPVTVLKPPVSSSCWILNFKPLLPLFHVV